MRRQAFFLVTVVICSWCSRADTYNAAILSSDGYQGSSATTLTSGTVTGSVVIDTSGPGSVIIPRSQTHAAVWQTASSTPHNLHPAGYYGSSITSSYGLTFGGVVTTAEVIGDPPLSRTLQLSQAGIWTGSTHAFTRLHSTDFYESRVSGCYGSQQVGYVSLPPSGSDPFGSSASNAALWNSTAESFVNLHPDSFDRSSAIAIWDNQQVGSGTTINGITLISHALMWEGSAQSVIDLHPDVFNASSAYDVWNGQQVGVAAVNESTNTSITQQTNALLWSGSANDYINLHPDGFYNSRAYAICGNLQVGCGLLTESTDSCHALLWSGTAESVIDLHSFLPEIYIRSEAADIDEFGNIAGTAYLADGTSVAVLWTPVPEPATLGLMALGMFLIRCKRIDK